MQRCVSRTRKQLGFTIIELMIVVGIIGLLVAVAIPLYDRYQAKVRQSEAKLALSAIFVTEKGFYNEYSSYVSSFEALQYRPEALRRFYTIGWNAAMSATVTGYSGTYGTPRYDRINTPPQFGCDAAAGASQLPAPVAANAQGFTVGAAGEVRIGMSCDVWTIDDAKDLRNSVLGI